jgi:hypothetical protein
MSWDVILIKTEKNTEIMKEIDETNCIPFEREYTISTLKQVFPDVNIDGNWMYYEKNTHYIQADLNEDKSLMFSIGVLDEPEDAVLSDIRILCGIFGCRAFCTASGEFLI